MRQLLSIAGAALVCASLAGQAPSPQNANGDAPAIRQRLDTLRKTAGSQWAETFDFFCATNPNRANRAARLAFLAGAS